MTEPTWEALLQGIGIGLIPLELAFLLIGLAWAGTFILMGVIVVWDWFKSQT